MMLREAVQIGSRDTNQDIMSVVSGITEDTHYFHLMMEKAHWTRITDKLKAGMENK